MSIEFEVGSRLKQYVNNGVMLDAWIQWASNPTSMSAGYGLEENKSMIYSNLFHRYSLTREEADEYVATLETETRELIKSGYDIGDLRNEILRQIQGSAGEFFRKMLTERIEKASLEARRITYLLYTLNSQGFDDFSYRSFDWEYRKNKFIAYYTAAYGNVFSASAFEEIFQIGVLNKLIWISSSNRSNRRTEYMIAPHPPLEELNLEEKGSSHEKDAPQLIEQLFNEHRFEELRILDEVSQEKFGYREYSEIPSIKWASSLCGAYHNSVAISPFLLSQVKDSLHLQKQNHIRELSRILEDKMSQLFNELWPEGDITSTDFQGEQFLWRVDSSVHPRLYVYLTNWLIEADLERIFPERAANAIFIILNQSIPSVKHTLFSKVAYFRYLELLFPTKNKISYEKAAGERYGYADKIIQLITKSAASNQSLTANASSLKQEPLPPQKPIAEPKPISAMIKSQNPKLSQAKETIRKSDSPIISASPQICSTPLSILMGSNTAGNVYWTPATERNWSIAIVGSAGTGKTQILKGILYELRKNNIPYLLFDFRNDYSERGSTASEFGKILDLNKISINPLEIDASNTPRDQKFQVSDIVDLVYNLGDVQIKYIRDAIQKSYREKGIFEENQQSWIKPGPTFTDVQHALENIAEEGTSEVGKAIKGIFARLDPIFEYEIFSGTTTIIPFEDLIRDQTIINLGILPNDNLKAIVCEFMLRKLRYYLYSLSESRDPRLFAVVDEAHRLKYERETSAGTLLKEGRKYGIGLVLATQDPPDFTDLVYNNVGATLSLQLNEPKYAKSVAEKIGVSGEALKDGLSEKFSAYIRFSKAPEPTKFKIKPYYIRMHE